MLIPYVSTSRRVRLLARLHVNVPLPYVACEKCKCIGFWPRLHSLIVETKKAVCLASTYAQVQAHVWYSVDRSR